MAVLEAADYGIAFSSGSATTASIIYSFGTNFHIICVSDVYGGTHRFMKQVAEPLNNVKVSMVDLCDPNALKNHLRSDTKVVWIETPSNPTMRLADIEAISKSAKHHSSDIVVVVDNTFLSPINQLPLRLGADIVIHSATKYLNGHCDVIMGVALTSDPVLAEKLRFMQNALGAVPSPFDCWLAQRGLKTLALRIKKQNENANSVAKFLLNHHKVATVNYPGLESHPQHELAIKQHSGHGGMISFQLKSDSLSDAALFTQSTQIFTLAESLGGIESLIEVPAMMTHASVPPEHRGKLGITDGLIRISCGIEDSQDLIEDLSQAFSKI